MGVKHTYVSDVDHFSKIRTRALHQSETTCKIHKSEKEEGLHTHTRISESVSYLSGYQCSRALIQHPWAFSFWYQCTIISLYYCSISLYCYLPGSLNRSAINIIPLQQMLFKILQVWTTKLDLRKNKLLLQMTSSSYAALQRKRRRC